MPPVTLSSLHVYPIKSCGGIDLQQAQVEDYGLAYDRNWVVVDESGKFVTQRQCPRMALIQPRLVYGVLRLQAPGMLLLEIPLDADYSAQETSLVSVWHDLIPAWDEGDLVAYWFSQFLGQSVRLMRFAAPHQRRCDPQWTGADLAHTRFADGYPILLTNTASLDELNARMHAKGSPSLPMNRFRPNIVVSGLAAFEEDFLESLTLDSLHLRAVKPCARCSVPSVDQTSGISTGPEPTATLSEFRQDERVQGVTFGQNLIVTGGVGASLQVGARLDVKLNF